MADTMYAFPVPSDANVNGDAGMTLRDWFAGQCDQPGISEIVSMAGHKTDGFWVTREGCEKEKFNDWWNGLPLTERLSLYARCRYATADAMLKAREKSS